MTCIMYLLHCISYYNYVYIYQYITTSQALSGIRSFPDPHFCKGLLQLLLAIVYYSIMIISDPVGVRVVGQV